MTPLHYICISAIYLYNILSFVLSVLSLILVFRNPVLRNAPLQKKFPGSHTKKKSVTTECDHHRPTKYRIYIVIKCYKSIVMTNLRINVNLIWTITFSSAYSRNSDFPTCVDLPYFRLLESLIGIK